MAFRIIQPILAQCFISILPERVRKPKFISRFQGVWKWNIVLQWGKAANERDFLSDSLDKG